MEIEAPISGFDVLKPHKYRAVKLTQIIKPLFQTKLSRQLSIKNLHGDPIQQQSYIGYNAYNIQVPMETEPSQSYELTEFDMRKRSPSVGTSIKRIGSSNQYSKQPEILKKVEVKPRAVSRVRNPRELQSTSVLTLKNQDLGYQVDFKRGFKRLQTIGDLPYENDNNNNQSFERIRPRPAGAYRPLLRSRVPDTSFSLLDNSIVVHQSEQQLSKSSLEKLKVPNPPLPKINKTLTVKDLVFGPNVAENILKRHAVDVFEGVKYALERVTAPSVSQIMPRMITLRKKEGNRKTLVLDLDETLVTTKARNEESGELPPIKGGNNPAQLTVRIRPYAEEFLREMSKEFEIVIFTAAEQKYAESIIKILDPNRFYISHILHRENCLKTRKGLYIKDLRLIKNRDLKDMVIVDNFVHSFSFQVENGIPIITWEGDHKDQELKYLMEYLKEAKKYDDMRQFNKERLRLAELLEVSQEKFIGF